MNEDHNRAEAEHTLEIARIRIRAITAYADTLTSQLLHPDDTPPVYTHRRVAELCNALEPAINQVRTNGR